MLIVDAYRNLAESSASISKRFHVSDTYAHDVFDRYVKLDRLPLTDAVSVDEVFLDMDDNCKRGIYPSEISLAYPVKSVKYPLSLRSSHGPALSRSPEEYEID